VAVNELSILIKVIGGSAVADLKAFKDAVASLGPAIEASFNTAAEAAEAGSAKIVAANKTAADSFASVSTAAKAVGTEIDAALAAAPTAVGKLSSSITKLSSSTDAAAEKVKAGMSGMQATFDEAATAAAGAADKTAAAWAGAKDKIVADAGEIKTSLAGAGVAQDAAAASAVVAGNKTAGAAEKSAAAAKAGASDVEAAAGGVAAGMSKSGDAAEKNGKSIKGSTTDWGMAAGAFGYLTDKVVKASSDWDASMHKLVQTAGEVPQNLDMVSSGLLKIGIDTGTSTKDLAQGMYLVESSGHHGADGLDVARRAAEMAKQENVPLAESITAVTTLMKDYPDRFKSAADATSYLVTATGNGNTTMRDLDTAMAKVLPQAGAMGISVDSVVASLDEMTKHGVSSSQAAQNLTDTLKHMEAPTDVQARELAALGMTTSDLAKSMDQSGLSGTLQMLTGKIEDNTHMTEEGKRVILDAGNAVKGYDPQVQALAQQLMNGTISQKDYTAASKALPPVLQGQAANFATLMKSTHGLGKEQQTGQQIVQTYTDALRRATGDQTGMSVAMMTTKGSAADLNDIQKKLAGTTKDADGSTKGWAETQRQANVHIDSAKVAVQALGIQMGSVLLPGVSKVVGGLAELLGWMGQCKPVADALGIALGVVLVAACIGFVTKGVGSAITGLSNLWSVMETVAGQCKRLATAIIEMDFAAFATKIRAVVTAVKEWTVAQWLLDAAMDANPIGLIIIAIAALIAIAILVITHWQQVKDFFIGLWDKLKSLFSEGWAWITKTVSEAWDKIKAFFSQSTGDILKQVGEFIGRCIGFFLLLPIEIPMALAKVAAVIVEAVKAWWPGFIKACEDWWQSTGKPWFANLGPNILKLLSAIGQMMADVGKAIIEGLWHGIEAAAGGLWDVIKGIGKGIVDQFKSVLGISSPSTVMHQHGMDTIGGVESGLKAGTPAVYAHMSTVPGGMTKPLDDAKPHFDKSGRDAMTGLHHGVEAGTAPVTASVQTMSATMTTAASSGISTMTTAVSSQTTANTANAKATKESTSATTADSAATSSSSAATTSASSATSAHSEATKTATAATQAHTEAQTANTEALTDSATQLDAMTKSMTDFANETKAAEPIWEAFVKDTVDFDNQIKAIQPVWTTFVKDYTTFGAQVKAVGPLWTTFVKDFTAWDAQLKAATPLWTQFVKDFTSWVAQLKSAAPLWTTYVKDFTTWVAQLKVAGPLWTQYVKDFTAWEVQLKAASPLWTLYVKDFTTWTAQLKIAAPLWTTYVKNFTTFDAQLKAVSPLWATFVKNFTTWAAQLKAVAALWTQFVQQFRQFAQFLAQANTLLTQFVQNMQKLQQTMKQMGQLFQDFNKQLQQMDQYLQQADQDLQQVDQDFQTFNQDLQQANQQLQQFQQLLQQSDQSAKQLSNDIKQLQQQLQQVSQSAQQAGQALKKAMDDGDQGVKKLDEDVKKLIDDLKKLIDLMSQAGISGGGGGGGGGGAGGAGASVGSAAVGGLTGSSGIASASPSQKTAQAGRDFVAGFTNAINAGQSDAAGAATDLGAGSVAATQQAIGAASESKLLREIGRWFVWGFIHGIEEEREHCRRACEQVATIATQTFAATSTLNAQYNTGVLYGKNLANGIVSQINATKLAAGKLAQAATTEATAKLARMGLVGQAGSGAQMPTNNTGPINLGTAQPGQQGKQHCVHEHRLFLDGREIRDITDRRVAKVLDRLTDQFSQQKR
jgi:TP901 family phage tail tape measure protein